MKLVVIDDYPLEGKTIEFLLKRDRPEIEYCGQALNGETGEALLLKTKPDIAVVDVKMPGMDGLTLLKKIKRQLPELHVIILSAFGEFAYVQSAIRLGACDYLLKPLDPEELYQAVDKIQKENQNQSLPHQTAKKAAEERTPENLDGLIQAIRSGSKTESAAELQKLWKYAIARGERSLQERKTLSKYLMLRVLEAMEEPEDGAGGEDLQEERRYLYEHFTTQLPAVLDTHSLEERLLEYVQGMANICGYNFQEAGDEQIERAKAIIERNIGSKLTLTMVAQEIYISSFYLSTLFKKRTGMNFIEYVMERRIERAKQLLKTTNETIETISAQVGYDESNYFRRLFKKKVGMTPREYRRQNARRRGGGPET